MGKKYELLEDRKVEFEPGRFLYQIKALRDIVINDEQGNQVVVVPAGKFGGFIEKEENLSHEGNCFVFDTSIVKDEARVSEDAFVYGRSIIAGNSRVYGNSLVYDVHTIDNAEIYDNAYIKGDVKMSDDSKVHGNVSLIGTNILSGNIDIASDADYFVASPIGFVNYSDDGSETVMYAEAAFYKTSDKRIVIPTMIMGETKLLTIDDFTEALESTLDEEHQENKETIDLFKDICNVARRVVTF